MASMTVATRHTSGDQLTGGGGIQTGTNGSQPSRLQIKRSEFAPLSTLPIPAVLDKSDLYKINKSTGEDLKFWDTQYKAALGPQRTQENILRQLYKAEKERVLDFSAFEAPIADVLNGVTTQERELLAQFKREKKKLNKINDAIISENSTAERYDNFGLVRSYALVEPKLVNQEDFRITVAQDPQLQRLLAEPYRKALQLQHYHRNYMSATKAEGNTLNHDTEGSILEALDGIKDNVGTIVRDILLPRQRDEEEQELKRGQNGEDLSDQQKRSLDKKYASKAKGFDETSCLIYVPNEGEDDYSLSDFGLDSDSDSDSDSDPRSPMNLDGPHIEERGGGVGGQSDKPPLPKEIEDIRSKIGGRKGPLSMLISSKVAPETVTKKELQEAEEQLGRLGRYVDAYCDFNGINPATYALTETHIKAFTEMVTGAWEAVQMLHVNINDEKGRDQYNSVKKRVELYIQEHQWPESFLHTLVPDVPEVLKTATNFATQNNLPPPLLPDQNAAKPQSSLPIPDVSDISQNNLPPPLPDQNTAKPQSSLPIPDVLDISHLSEIKECNEEDHKFWTIQYGAAQGFQAAQTRILEALKKEEIERQKNVKAFQTTAKDLLDGPTTSSKELRSQLKEQVEELDKVNDAIALANVGADRDEFFGQVQNGLVEPKLNNQDDFKLIVTQSPILQLSLAKLYRKALELQHYHYNFMKATTGYTRDASIESSIRRELDDINDDVGHIVLKAFKEELEAIQEEAEEELRRKNGGKITRAQKKNLNEKTKSEFKLAQKQIELKSTGSVYVPNEGEDDYSIPGFEPGDGLGGQSNKQPLPKEIEVIRVRMGGREGPLFIFVSNGPATEEAKSARRLLKSLGDEVDKICDAKGIDRAAYALTENHIGSFRGMVKVANDFMDAIIANTKSGDADAKYPDVENQYQQLRSQAKLFLQEHQWPEQFLDTFIPPAAEAKEMVSRILRLQTTSAPPAEDTDEQCIRSCSIPGIVEEMEDGILRQKRVVNVRHSGFTKQLVLKSYGANPAFKNRYIFELVSAKCHPGAFEEYQAMHGVKTLISTPYHVVKDRPWRQVLIGGVLPIRRSEHTTYMVKGLTLIYVKFPGDDFIWVTQSTLKRKFGTDVAEAKMNQYMMESGQKPSKAPTKRVFVLSEEELEAQEYAQSRRKKATKEETETRTYRKKTPRDFVPDESEDEPRRKKATKGETRMTRTRKYPKKTPLKSAHSKSKTSWPETDGEEEGDSVADESERSENEDDAGSMVEFIVDDDAVKYTDEDIAKQQAILDKMMKQRNK
ncbi:hypothetical protein V491_02894 [Pseudogymnoascus sp. VKM F-3775]|nr:hypothetical protein V491_02894 [Pseudogymnoascus sp. VKM F-3775]